MRIVFDRSRWSTGHEAQEAAPSLIGADTPDRIAVRDTLLWTRDGLACLKCGGRLVVAGIKAAAIDGLDINAVILWELVVRGVFGSSTFGVRRAVEMLAEARYPFSELHTHRFGLAQLDDALRILGGEVPDERPLHMTIVP